MKDDTIKRSDAIKVVSIPCGTCFARDSKDCEKCSVPKLSELINAIPSADRQKHYCAECKFKSIDKRCMPCSSCTNNPKNRNAFISCEVERSEQ